MTMPIQYDPMQAQQAAIRPPRVEFETRAEEDRDATLKAGQVIYKDVIYVKVTPPGSFSVYEGIASEWIERQHMHPYHPQLVRALEAFKAGLEPPVNGTAVETCTTFTPAEIKQIKVCCRTVEDLAAWPDGSLGMLGMGGVRLKQKAQAWIASAAGTGKLATELDALKAEKETQASTIAELQNQLRALQAKLESQEGPRERLSLKKGDAA